MIDIVALRRIKLMRRNVKLQVARVSITIKITLKIKVTINKIFRLIQKSSIEVKQGREYSSDYSKAALQRCS